MHTQSLAWNDYQPKNLTMFISMFPSLCLCQYVYLNLTIPHHVLCTQYSVTENILFHPHYTTIITSFVWRFAHLVEVLLNYNSIRPTQMFFDNFCAHSTYFQCNKAIMIIIHLIAEINSQFSEASQLFCNKCTPTQYSVVFIKIRCRFVSVSI